jgi:hypothetical protein
VVTPKANPRLSNGTKSGIKGHIAAEAKANPKEMRTKPTSQLEKGTRKHQEGRAVRK